MLPRASSFLLFVLLLLSFISCACASLENITVDDTFGDSSGFSLFSLIPPNGGYWNNGPNCTKCDILPETSQCVDQTFHGATTGVNGTQRGYNLTFYGVSFFFSLPLN